MGGIVISRCILSVLKDFNSHEIYQSSCFR